MLRQDDEAQAVHSLLAIDNLFVENTPNVWQRQMLESKGRLIVVKKDKDKRQFRSTSGHKMDTNNVHNRICYKKHGKKLDGVNMQIKLKNQPGRQMMLSSQSRILQMKSIDQIELQSQYGTRDKQKPLSKQQQTRRRQSSNLLAQTNYYIEQSMSNKDPQIDYFAPQMPKSSIQTCRGRPSLYDTIWQYDRQLGRYRIDTSRGVRQNMSVYNRGVLTLRSPVSREKVSEGLKRLQRERLHLRNWTETLCVDPERVMEIRRHSLMFLETKLPKKKATERVRVAVGRKYQMEKCKFDQAIVPVKSPIINLNEEAEKEYPLFMVSRNHRLLHKHNVKRQ